ncbi:MAG: Holliday junction branch migration protein RuvA [Candidatus Paceibacterota bacterium]
MIARITGTLVDIVDKGVVVETAGIGYLISTPFPPAQLGDTVTLHTHMVIRDDAHELYGFATAMEKALFSILISVSGVGPKTALQMLTLYTLPELVRSIKDGDAKAISLVPGIGKKTAEKVVIDLKDKLDGFTTAENGLSTDLFEALLSLGYKEQAIRTIASTIDAQLPIEKQITVALQLLGK